MHFENKHIYCTLLINYYFYIYIYIYAFNNTLVSHHMYLLYNLKVKYLFIFIIYSIKLGLEVVVAPSDCTKLHNFF